MPSPTIPLFPLPNVVLFPKIFLPLHIFEPRYQAMVTDALTGDRMLGMVLLQPGYEADYEGRPAIYPIGCAGVITHAQPLDDGRFSIVLRGTDKFRVLAEDDGKAYRLARVEMLPEPTSEADRAGVQALRLRLEALLAALAERTGGEPRFPPAVPDDDLVNALAQYLDLEPIERQALLEYEGVLARCRGLIDLIQMKLWAGEGPGTGRSVH